MIKYLSSSGLDTASGSASAPWATLARLEEALVSGELGQSDSALLNRGDTFYGNLTMPSISGTTGVFTLGAYGFGAKPKISGYKVSANSWVEHTTGVWKLNLTANSGQYSGNVLSTSTNVGFLKVGGVFKGVKRWDLTTLANEWDFYSDATFVYVKKTTSPGANVEIAIGQNGIRMASDSAIQNLHIHGHGGHGVGVYSGSNYDVYDCLIEDIGGSQLSDTTRYGNGIEVWIGSSNFTARGNTIRQTYDVAYTMQGAIEGANKAWTNVIFNDNVIENCNQSFEVWATGTPAVDAGFFNCAFTNNICVSAGESWASDIRPDSAGKGTHLLSYTVSLGGEISITGNVFHEAKHNYAYHSTGAPSVFKSSGNTISLAPGQKIVFQDAETVEQHAAYVTRTGKEVGSKFFVNPIAPTNLSDASVLLASKSAFAIQASGKNRLRDSGDPVRDKLLIDAIDQSKVSGSGITGSYRRVATMYVNSQYGTVDALLAFQNGQDNDVSRTFGFLDIRVGGNGSQGGSSSKVGLTIMGTPTTQTSSGLYSATDFIAVKTQSDTVNHIYVVEFWLKSSDTFSDMIFRPLIVQESSGSRFQLWKSPEYATVLPAGTQVTPTLPAYIQRPQTGTVPPITVPPYVGAEYLDTVAKRQYKAFGTSSVSDWIPTNHLISPNGTKYLIGATDDGSITLTSI